MVFPQFDCFFVFGFVLGASGTLFVSYRVYRRWRLKWLTAVYYNLLKEGADEEDARWKWKEQQEKKDKK